MSVFVDPSAHPYGRMVMCHMWADTLDELLAMADRIGLARRWLQRPPKASWVHFDISKSKRVLAVRHGAIETDRFEASAFVARARLAEAEDAGDEKRAAACREMLAMVEHARLRRVPVQGDILDEVGA